MNDLVERYIYAATKRMPRKQREDVSLELRGLVEDMLAERCGSVTPTEKDIRIVLTELGTPQELAEQYNEEKDKCLIGQPYYSTYKFVLKIVLASVSIGLTVSNVIYQMVEPQVWYGMAARMLSVLWNGLLSAFAIVTLLFTFFYRKGIKISEPFNFDDLPPVPKKSQEISKWDSIMGIGFCVVFVVLFVFTPEVFCVIYEGKTVSLFDLEAIRNSWFLVTAFGACGIIRDAVQLMEGRYNKKVMVTALVTNGLSGILSIWWLAGFDVMNQTFLANLETIFAGENAFIYQIFANFDLFFLGLILFILVLDSIEVAVKTLRK